MPTLTQLMPYVLDQTVIDKPGWSARARLLLVVASRTQYDDRSATIIGAADLQAYGRSPRQAQWDLELLKRMAIEDRTVTRIPTRRRGTPDLWMIRGTTPDDVRLWRHVPWAVSAAAAARGTLCAYENDVRSGLEPITAGQARGWSRFDPRFEGFRRPILSAKEPVPAPNQPAPAPNSSAHSEAPTRSSPESWSAPSPCLSERDSLSHSLETERASEQRPSSQQKRVLAELSELLRAPIHGVMRDRLYGLVEVHQDHIEELLEFCRRTLRGTRYVAGALEAIEGWTPPAARPARDPRLRIETLRQLIPVYAKADDPKLADLEAELATLEDQVTGRVDG